ncbi:MAG: octaprenyl diphosphate synthase, partial [Gammaproteobacteria bacterium]|nr:octaprenyl diphosphate synthase [Gammaproteobacteria bacterium]
STGGLEYTTDRALEESRRALESLASLPHTPYRDGLAALAHFAAEHTT